MPDPEPREIPHGLPPHLVGSLNGRGFAQLPVLTDVYGGTAAAYESSAALEPHLRLAVTDGLDGAVAQLHLTAEQAWQLADQLRHLVVHHYQGDARPDWAIEGGAVLREHLRPVKVTPSDEEEQRG